MDKVIELRIPSYEHEWGMVYWRVPVSKLYRKIGKRYVEVDEQWLNPAEGVWIVVNKPGERRRSLIMRLGEAPSIMQRAAFEKHRELISTVICGRKDGWSAWELAGDIVAAVAKAEEKEGRG